STRPGPRKDKRPQLSLPKTLPTPPSVRDIADRITAQARAALTVVAERKPNLKSSQSLPHRKLTVRRGAPPRTETRVAAAVVADKAPGVVDARPVEAEVPTALSEVVGRVTTEGRAVLTDIADRIANPVSGQDRRVVKPIAAMTPPVAAPRSAPLVNIVGSLVFNVVGAALQVFSGPPVLPPGSNVTVRTSTLEMPGTNQTVRADWYFPEDPDSASGVIYLQHGFMATGPMYSYTAAYLAEETNSIVVVPTLSSNLFDTRGEWIGGEPIQQSVADLFAGGRPELTASASAAAGHPVTLPTKFVLVGHSLGGMLVTGAAGRMVDNGAVDDLAGVVLLDAVDTHNDMPEALEHLTGANYRPVLLISSEPYVWNRNGTVGQELQTARPGEFNGVMLVGGRHIDGLQGANPILQFAEYLIAGFSQPQNVDAVKTISAGWINDMYHGTDSGVYGAPQESIEIPTSSGAATAVVLPFTSTDPVQATPWDGLVQPLLDALFQFAVYEPLAGQSVLLTV
ncbi:hypothetical protein A5669_30015, partial [Mycolicibacterium fortuitum]